MEKIAKTDNFLKAIYKYADEQRNSMRTEVEQLKEEKLKEAAKKGKYDSQKLINDRLEAKKNEETGSLAKKMQESQKTLFLERARMTDEVFAKAEKKLISYAETEEYATKLIDSAKQISGLFGENRCVLYVNERDLKYSDKINAVFGGKSEIFTDNSIKIGGIKGFCKALSIIADETLDSKLHDQREWFIENSGLSVL